MTYTDAETAERYVDIVASLSELGKPHFGREMLLSNYSGVEPSLTSLDQVEEELAKVEEATASLSGHPAAYLQALITGTRAVLGIIRGEERPYLDLVKDILQIDFVAIPEREATRLRAELATGLDELGYGGSLERQVDAWLQDTSLEGEAVIEFGQEIIDDARHATQERVVSLPEGEGIDSFTGIRDVFYSGRSKYTGDYRGWLHFNIDKHWQKDLFVQVLCHEAYPGHQTFYALWDELFREGRWPVEAAFYQRNAPTNPIFEGGPESAMHFIGWDVGDSPRAKALRLGQTYKDLGRIAMNNACLWCNLGEMTKDEAVAYQVEHFVLPDDAERAYRFFTHPLSRTHYPQYYYGRRIVKEAFALLEDTEAGRQRFWDIIYRTPHTTQTFIDAIRAATDTAFDPFAYR